MILTVFITTVLVLCASLFATMAIVPLMIENRSKRNVPDNIVPFSPPYRLAGQSDTPAA